MDTNVDEATTELNNSKKKEECCVGCLSKDPENLSNANVNGLLKDFLNRELTHLFKYVPALLCTDCLTQMEAHINFKICVENSIAELEKDIPKPKGRGRPKGSVNTPNGRGRGRPKKSENDNEHSDDEEDDPLEAVASTDVYTPSKRGRKRKSLVYNMDTDDSDDWDPKKNNKALTKIPYTPSGGRRGRPPKVSNGTPKKVVQAAVAGTSSGKKGRGRPKKIRDDNDDDDDDGSEKLKKKRGRPKKQGADTEDETDDESFEKNDDDDVEEQDDDDEEEILT